MKRNVKTPSELDNLLMGLAQLSFEKHGWDISWGKEKNKRTLSQNNLYHKWLDIIARHLGYDHDEMGQTMMKHLIPPTHEVKLPCGTMDQRWSTTKLDVPKMKDYIDKLDRWAAGEGIFLPHPEDMHARK